MGVLAVALQAFNISLGYLVRASQCAEPHWFSSANWLALIMPSSTCSWESSSLAPSVQSR
jgi:hypothetical protein